MAVRWVRKESEKRLGESPDSVILRAARWWFAERIRRDSRRAAGFLRSPVLDRDELIRLADKAKYHGIMPIVAAWLEHSHPAGNVRELFAPLVAQCEREAERQLRAIELLAAELRSAQVEAIFYRGISLSQLGYEGIATRTAQDIDLIVDLASYGDTCAVLSRMGFLNRTLCPHDGRAMEWKSSSLGVVLDLHFVPVPAEYGPSPSFSELWERSQQADSGDRRELSREDLYLLQAHHGYRHLWARMKWLLDLAVIEGNGACFDGSLVEALARKYRMERIVSVGASLAYELVGYTPRDTALPGTELSSARGLLYATVKMTIERRRRFIVPIADRLLNRIFRYLLLESGEPRKCYRAFLVRRLQEQLLDFTKVSETARGKLAAPIVLLLLIATRSLLRVTSFRKQQAALRSVSAAMSMVYRDRFRFTIAPVICRSFVRTAAAHPRLLTCYVSAWTGAVLSACCGYRSRIRFGVRRGPEGMLHHAWCEVWSEGRWCSVDSSSGNYLVLEDSAGGNELCR